MEALIAVLKAIIRKKQERNRLNGKWQKKKKKTGKRHLRKQARKQPQQPFDKWLAKHEKQLKILAKIMTRMPPKYPREIHNKKFFDPVLKKTYCVHIDGNGISFCEDCYYRRCFKPVMATKRHQEL